MAYPNNTQAAVMAMERCRLGDAEPPEHRTPVCELCGERAKYIASWETILCPRCAEKELREFIMSYVDYDERVRQLLNDIFNNYEWDEHITDVLHWETVE